ncbi:hypothetical protein [Paenibacillus sp. PL91]|uniref:hypothetical protein n=1 Tax=Paenibacillus sp. PL91 TaxID=2729538 RepID=UPI00145D0DC5|nr:hypothetical protein [Paenibacillus sp. PL91]MBC9204476.1 hypothetical protein [Paenibacillus sp. PL91]
MKLIELRIPEGFAVCYNKFYDVEPVPVEDGDGFIKNWHYFTEDLLQIIKMEIVNGKWIVPQNGQERLIIDLGWYPDSRVDGEYKLVVVNDTWETLKEKQSKSRFEIKETLENWLELILTRKFDCDT